MGELDTMHMLHTLDVAVGDTGSTVRSGFKWAALSGGDTFNLCVCTPIERGFAGGSETPAEHDVQGQGKCDYLWFGYFKNIPAKLLSYEHEVRSREYWGLFDSMHKAYGQEFGESSPVTVVVYTRVS